MSNLSKQDYVNVGTILIKRAVWIGVALWAALWFASSISTLLSWILTAFALSFAVEPIVNFLEDKTNIKTRGGATGIAMALCFAVILGLVALVVPAVASQASKLIDQLPAYMEQLEGFLRDRGVEIEQGKLISDTADLQTSLSKWGSRNAVSLGSTIASGVFQAVTITMFLFYIVADGPQLRRAICSRMPKAKQIALLNAWEIGIEKTGQYFYTRILLAAASSLFTTIVLVILGVPYAIVMGLWVGVVSQFIPGFGTYIAAVVPTLIALGEKGVVTGVIVVAALVFYQQIENYILSPRLTSKTMNIHPALAFGGAMAGASAFGFIGAFMALPVIGVIKAVSSNYGKQYKIVQNELTEDAALQKSKTKKTSRSSIRSRSKSKG